MCKEAWAWEMTRRNENYIVAWNAHLKRCQKQSYLPENIDFKKNEITKASEFGLLFFIDPDLDSKSTDVFWSPKVTPFILKCSIVKHNEKCFKKSLLSDISLEFVYVETFDNLSHLIVKDGYFSIQLLFDKKLNLKSNFDFEVHLPTQCNFPEQLQTASYLSQFLSFRECREFHLLSASKVNNNIDALFAFDLSKQNLSQREIAIRLYGENELLNGWEGVSDNIRSKTRRIIKRGEQLVAAGYKTFLKPTNI